jgi:hypothetical protein
MEPSILLMGVMFLVGGLAGFGLAALAGVAAARL